MRYAPGAMRPEGGAMTDNRQVEAAWTYHNSTKHSYQSVRSSRHSLDFSNQPIPFKIYKTLEPIPLPRELQAVPMRALKTIAASPSGMAGDCIPDLSAIAMLLYLSAGITRERHVGDWERSEERR